MSGIRIQSVPSDVLSILGWLGFCVLLYSPTTAANPLPRGSLQLHKPASADLQPGQIHEYSLTLEPGLYVRIAFVQPRFAIVLRMLPPDADSPIELHLPQQQSGRQLLRWGEPLCWISKGAGAYRVQIVASEAGSPDRYEIELEEVRRAKSTDSTRVTEQAVFEKGRSLESKYQYKEAIAAWKEAASLSRQLGDGRREATALYSIGKAHESLSQFREGVPYYQQALRLFHRAGDRRNEGSTLIKLGWTYQFLTRYPESRLYYERAIALCRSSGDRQCEGRATGNIGSIYFTQGYSEQSIVWYGRALVIAHEIHDERSEAGWLYDLAIGSSALSRYEAAIQYYEQALAMARSLQIHDLVVYIIEALGHTHQKLSHFDKAIEYYNAALADFRRMNDRRSVATALANLGELFNDLNQPEKAVSYLREAVEVARSIPLRREEATALNNLGYSYSRMDRFQEALPYYEEALKAERDAKDRAGEGSTLLDLGAVSCAMGLCEEALTRLEEALRVLREVKDRKGESRTLKEMGIAYGKTGRNDEAIAHYTEALSIAREIKSRDAETESLAGLMDSWKKTGVPRLAVFYGKQAVNTIQSIRSDTRTLDPEMRRSFLEGNETPYHVLADLLLSQGRLAEAEQVLGLLKEEEFFEFVRRDIDQRDAAERRVDMTPEEAESMASYAKAESQRVSIGRARGALAAKATHTDAELREIARLDKELAVGSQSFEKFLDDLVRRFRREPEAGERVQQLREARGIMSDLRELPGGTVAIYTLAAEDRFHAILVTPDVEKHYEVEIGRADLNRKVQEFRAALQQVGSDPRPLGRELYNILIGPMADDLRQADAKTLMFSLDGALRYLPVSALFDGKQYLVESFPVAVFTPASHTRIKERPDREWKAAGFGVTRAYDGEAALPGVHAELASIIAEEPGADGVLPGEIRLDDRFTEVDMKTTLLKHFPVVHIATHFHFQPGDETKSYLLLGDGAHLSLETLRYSQNLFEGVQLLTLSACNTGIGDRIGDGNEVEGFGVLAQRQGAKSVVASLWAVADASTSILMQEFYRIRQSAGSISKIEALRRAQLNLMRGSVVSETGANRGVRLENANAGAGTGRQAAYSHPYYWAAFFLMGNWL